MRSTDHEAPRHAFPSIHMIPPPQHPILEHPVFFPQQAELQFLMFSSLYFPTANWKTEDSGPSVSRHSLSSLCPEFLQEYREYEGALNLPPRQRWQPFLKVTGSMSSSGI